MREGGARTRTRSDIESVRGSTPAERKASRVGGKRRVVGGMARGSHCDRTVQKGLQKDIMHGYERGH
jgi:hypothetical protein